MRGFRDPYTLQQTLDAYPADRELLWQARVLFISRLNSYGESEQAAIGLTECVLWLLKGQMLLGNDYVATAFSLRFPTGNQEPPPIESEIAVLNDAIAEYEIGIAYIGDLIENPQVFDRPNLVELTRLFQRIVIARNGAAERLFSLGLRSRTRRAEAAEELRRTAQWAYLGAAVLASAQDEEGFRSAGGDRIAARLARGTDMFRNIMRGVNPQAYHRNYTPFLPYFDSNPDRSLRTLADRRAGVEVDIGAKYWDEQARQTSREVDRLRTALQQNLSSIRIRVIDELRQIAGNQVDPARHFEDGRLLRDEQAIVAFIELARSGTGTLGQEITSGKEALAATEAALVAIQNIPRKIRIEEERAGQVASVLFRTGKRLAALEVAKGIAGAHSVSCGIPAGCSVTFNPGEIVKGFLNAESQMLQTMQGAQIEGINSAATIKLYLLEMAERSASLREHEARVNQASLRITNTEGRIRALLNEWDLSLAENLDAYWSDPGYRVEMEHAVERAHESLRSAFTWSFLAAKALSYDWADEFPGEAELDPPYNQFDGPEGVFGCPNAECVLVFLEALREYATWNFGNRGPRADIDTTTVSLSSDVLGFNDGDRFENRRRFQQFILDHWNGDVIEFDFDLSIADEHPGIFPIWINNNANFWNIKIVEVAADVQGAGLIRGHELRGRLGLFLGGMSTVRHFNARWRPDDPTSDAMVFYDLESMNADGSLRSASIQATVNGFNEPPQEGDFTKQLERLSPAAARWRVSINTQGPENRLLDFTKLEDIRLRFRWRYGQPDPYGP